MVYVRNTVTWMLLFPQLVAGATVILLVIVTVKSIIIGAIDYSSTLAIGFLLGKTMAKILLPGPIDVFSSCLVVIVVGFPLDKLLLRQFVPGTHLGLERFMQFFHFLDAPNFRWIPDISTQPSFQSQPVSLYNFCFVILVVHWDLTSNVMVLA